MRIARKSCEVNTGRIKSLLPIFHLRREKQDRCSRRCFSNAPEISGRINVSALASRQSRSSPAQRVSRIQARREHLSARLQRPSVDSQSRVSVISRDWVSIENRVAESTEVVPDPRRQEADIYQGEQLSRRRGIAIAVEHDECLIR